MPFPTSVPLQCPLERRLMVPTRVIEMLDGSEQRWVSGDPLNAFTAQFVDVPAADYVAVENWFLSVKGTFDSTITFTSVDGVAYPHMGLEQDELPIVTSRAGRFSFSVQMRQVAPDGAYSGTATPVYPALASGCYVQRPFTRNNKFSTVRNDLASGPRVARYERGGVQLRGWDAQYPVLRQTDLEGRLAFFVAMRGRYREFEFHDPVSGTDTDHCRFESDVFTARALGAGVWATSLGIVEFVG